jgi:ethanolamine utilization microcompartment shell protein EutL
VLRQLREDGDEASDCGRRFLFKMAFDGSPKAAAADARTAKDLYGPKGANSGGSAIASGRVLIIYARPQPAASLDKVKSCAF